MPWLLAGIPMSSLLARKACLLQNSPPQSPSPGSPLILWLNLSHCSAGVCLHARHSKDRNFSFVLDISGMNEWLYIHTLRIAHILLYILQANVYCALSMNCALGKSFTRWSWAHWIRTKFTRPTGPMTLDVGKKKITFSFALTPTEIQHFLQFWIADSNTQLHLQYVACCR